MVDQQTSPRPSGPQREPLTRYPFRWALVITAVVALVVLAGNWIRPAGWSGEPNPGPGDLGTTPTAGTAASEPLPDEVPSLIEGESVRFRAAVAQVMSEDVFFMATRDEAPTPLVVIDATGDAQLVKPGDKFEVRGRVEPLDAEALKEDYGVEITDDVSERYAGELVVVAETFRKL